MATVTEAQQSRWRLPIKWRTLWITLLAVGWGAVIVGIVGAFFFKWGWTTSFKSNGQLWDWLQLLFAPVLAGVLPFVIREHQDQSNPKPPELEPPIPGDHQQEAVLQAYLDRMSDLLFNRGLRESQPGNNVRGVARAWTLMDLQRVGKDRKGVILRFLHEAGLISKGKVIIDLNEADLRWADLSNSNLSDSELSGVDLTGADLSNSNLSRANLSGANLSEANLSRANLSEANLSRANLHRTDLTDAILNGVIYQGSS